MMYSGDRPRLYHVYSGDRPRLCTVGTDLIISAIMHLYGKQ